MGNVVNLTFGRRKRGKKLPKPVMCKDCDEPIETARLQALDANGIRAGRCIACQKAWERRLDRQMEGIRAHEAVRVLR